LGGPVQSVERLKASEKKGSDMVSHSVGLIGCGWVAPFHVAALRKLGDRVRIAWVADPVRERAELIAKEAKSPFLTDYREGLRDVNCTFVLTPHHVHHRTTIDCLEAGCHVLLEKPISTTLQDADDMIASAERVGRILMVAFPHTYRKGVRFFKQVLDSGKYGRIIRLDGMMDESVRGYALGWISRKETLGGGVFFSASTHMLDVMLYICGPVQTICMVGTRGGLEMEGEDTACSVIKFRNGAIGVTRHTWVSPSPGIWYTMSVICEKAFVTLTTTPLGDLVGEGDRCSWLTRVVANGAKPEVLYEADEGLDFAPEVEHFLDCVETGQKPRTDGRMARDLLALVLEAYRKADIEGGNV
jgi:predicted dehydrogenase